MDAVLTVELSMRTADGTLLTAATEMELARKWAAHVWGPRWVSQSRGRQAVEVAAALRDIHEMVHQREPVLI